jgi:hypothetical protein
MPALRGRAQRPPHSSLFAVNTPFSSSSPTQRALPPNSPWIQPIFDDEPPEDIAPPQPIFDDEPPEDIAPRHTPGRTTSHCARAKVFCDSALKGIDIAATPCCRRAHLPALELEERSPKSWSWTIKNRATQSVSCSRLHL